MVDWNGVALRLQCFTQVVVEILPQYTTVASWLELVAEFDSQRVCGIGCVVAAQVLTILRSCCKNTICVLTDYVITTREYLQKKLVSQHSKLYKSGWP